MKYLIQCSHHSNPNTLDTTLTIEHARGRDGDDFLAICDKAFTATDLEYQNIRPIGYWMPDSEYRKYQYERTYTYNLDTCIGVLSSITKLRIPRPNRKPKQATHKLEELWNKEAGA